MGVLSFVLHIELLNRTNVWLVDCIVALIQTWLWLLCAMICKGKVVLLHHKKSD